MPAPESERRNDNPSGDRSQRPQNEETFQPGVTITEDGVSLFATDFRAQALRDGVLVDVSDKAREIGFVFPVAVTKAIWEDIQAIPQQYEHETVEGRLWDVLLMAGQAVSQSRRGAAEIRYNLILHVNDREVYPFRLVCQPGDNLEAVITLSNPEKDIDLALGEIVLTEGALDALVSAHVSPATYLARHKRGDWGEVDAEDKVANDRAARSDGRVLSSYMLPPTGQKLWLITEWDRSVTTLLLPSEY